MWFKAYSLIKEYWDLWVLQSTERLLAFRCYIGALKTRILRYTQRAQYPLIKEYT